MRVYHRRGCPIGKGQKRVARAIRLRRMPGDVGVSPTTKFPLLLARRSSQKSLDWVHARQGRPILAFCEAKREEIRQITPSCERKPASTNRRPWGCQASETGSWPGEGGQVVDSTRRGDEVEQAVV